MSLFSGPEEHAANPPESWVARKVGDHAWHLETKDGGVLHYSCHTRREAEAMKREGSFYFRLWHNERRWYAGEPVNGWKTWEQCKAERDAIAARWASR